MQENVSQQQLVTDQMIDTLTRVQLNSHVSTRLLSVRCREAQTQSLLNQDYASIVSSEDGDSLSFCVCDGVGSSYKGDFAARYLTTQLLAWLQELTEVPKDIEAFTATLHGLLDLWAYDARLKLKKMLIPPETPSLAREVMEELRDTYGSETVFLCGRIDAFSRFQPARAVFCWMGNVAARLTTSSQKEIVLGHTSDKSGRWSTVKGRRGDVGIWHASLPVLEHLIVHTDGLDSVSKKLALLTDEQWYAQTQHLLSLPSNDDMTALEIRWQLVEGENES
jgi:hypothetical protein